jgi:predicted ATPase/DNA-binding SARP family transcriptional activator
MEGEQRLAVGGRKQLALLAFFLLHANRAISSDALIEAIWGSARSGPDHRLKMAVARLRKVLEPASENGAPRLRTIGGGYMLSVGPGELDADTFEMDVKAGQRALRGGEPARARELLDQALRLWRGPPLAEVTFEEFVQGEIRRLEEVRLAAIEARVDADLALGRHQQLVAELEVLSEEHPTRERFAAQLMIALYRCGRQADALEVYRQARTRLVETLGVEPGSELRELQVAILVQASSLEAGIEPGDDAQEGRATPAVLSGVRPPTHSLPVSPTATVGRQEEVRTVGELLAGPDVRLVTLTGTGGVGKTRVALEVAHTLRESFPDGAHWVELAGVGRAEDVGPGILRALGVTSLPGEDAGDALRRYLARRRVLLVIDNFEHVLDAAELVGELHGTCPGLTFLVTSREPLNLAAENRVHVAPLPVPALSTITMAEIESIDASALFLAAARRHDSHFSLTPDAAPAVAKICARLDGLPLALELAAARTGIMGVEELAARLEETVGELGVAWRDAPARQRTLNATIQWSYRLLDTRQQRAFAHFAVFAGGATLEATQKVTGAAPGTIEELLSKSLLERRRQADGSTRFLLLETVRQYALERLEDDREHRGVREAHLEHYLELVEWAVPRLGTLDEGEAFAVIDREIDNLRAALRWALIETPVTALRLAGGVGEYWDIRSDAEGLQWLDAALAAAGKQAPARDRARALLLRSRQLFQCHRFSDVSVAATAALDLSQQSRDHAAISAACDWLAQTAPMRGKPDEVRGFAEDAARHARLAGNDVLLGRALLTLATRTWPASDSLSILEDAAELLTRSGNYRELAAGYSDAAWFALQQDRPSEAAAFLTAGLPIAERGATPLVAMVIHGNLGWAYLLTGNVRRAQASFVQQLQSCSEHGFRYGVHEGLAGLAAVSATDGEPETAASLLGSAHALGWPTADGQPIDDRIEHDYFEPARERYGLAAWRQAEQAGAMLSPEDAIASALAYLSPVGPGRGL